jgi:hypothetical protein
MKKKLQLVSKAVVRIRICKFLGLADPDPDPEPSMKKKNYFDRIRIRIQIPDSNTENKGTLEL